MLGARITEEARAFTYVQEKDGRQRVCFEERPADDRHVTLYAPQTPASSAS